MVARKSFGTSSLDFLATIRRTALRHLAECVTELKAHTDHVADRNTNEFTSNSQDGFRRNIRGSWASGSSIVAEHRSGFYQLPLAALSANKLTAISKVRQST